MRKLHRIVFISLSLLLLFASAHANQHSQRRVGYFSKEGGNIPIGNKVYESKPIKQLKSFLEPGTTAIVLPGVYKKKIEIKAVGTTENPILIKALNKDVILDGGLSPTKDGSYCVYLKNSKHIELNGFTIKNCWPVAVYLKNSSQIKISNLDVIGSRYMVRAKGKKSEFITIENNTWNQDPSGKLWKEYDWSEMHHGRLVYYNGSILTAKGINNVQIKGNTIRNAYNGVRLLGDANEITSTNANVEISNNLFENIRDNPIEPEISAYNWWIHHNRIHNAHSWISITELTGGYIYIFGNVGWNDDMYGKEGDHNKGTVLKFEKSGPFPIYPVYVFNNTWVTSGDYIRPKTPTRNLFHFNNIIYSQKRKSTLFVPTNYHASYHLGNDLIYGQNSKKTINHSIWKNLVHRDPLFANIQIADFRLKQQSPAIDSGIVLHIDGWSSEFEGQAPTIGAYEGEKLIKGPAFFKR